MTRLNFATIVVAAILVANIAANVPTMANPISYPVWQTGSASEQDKQQAHDEAYQDAVNSLNNGCAGVIQDLEETNSSYITSGVNPLDPSSGTPTYNAMVTVKAFCVIGR